MARSLLLSLCCAACGGGGSGSVGTQQEGQVCNGALACASPAAVCSPYQSGASLDICRVSCVADSDCTVAGESCQDLNGSTCTCSDLGGVDSCSSAVAGTLCHPEYLLCVKPGTSAPTNCGPGECADPVVFICRPAGDCASPDAG